MLCDNCKKNKAVFLVKEIMMGEERDIYLCQSCAFDKGLTEVVFDFKFNLKNFINSVIEVDDTIEELLSNNKVCEKCGTSLNEILEDGLLGCAHCFVSFMPVLTQIYSKVFNTKEHYGKIPIKLEKEVEILKRLEEYKIELQKAIKEENYERAAFLRDKIKELSQIKTDSN